MAIHQRCGIWAELSAQPGHRASRHQAGQYYDYGGGKICDNGLRHQHEHEKHSHE